MGAAGYPPSLAAVEPGADPSLLAAFAHGVDIASTVLTGLVLVVLAVLVTWAWRAHARAAGG